VGFTAVDSTMRQVGKRRASSPKTAAVREAWPNPWLLTQA
jgi:hypothetical protein